MLKAGGEAKRKDLITAFEEISLAERISMTEEEQKKAKWGDEGQGENMTSVKGARQQKK